MASRHMLRSSCHGRNSWHALQKEQLQQLWWTLLWASLCNPERNIVHAQACVTTRLYLVFGRGKWSQASMARQNSERWSARAETGKHGQRQAQC